MKRRTPIHRLFRPCMLGLLQFALIVASAVSAGQADAAPVTIPNNGVKLYDTAGNLLHAHGGGIIKVGSYYYWFGENRTTSDKFYAVSVYRSSDLKTWEFRNNVLTQSSAAELQDAKIERPKVIYNAQTGRFVMWMHKENGTDYGEARAAVAYSSTVDGTYTYVGSFRPFSYMSRDCTLFVDDDGSAYFVSAANENYDLHLYKLSPDYLSIGSLVQKIWVGGHREAPALFKRNGIYFLITSGATGWSPNQQKYGYATSLSGTWSALSNLGNATTYDSQTAYVLPVQGSQTTSYLYIGDRWTGAWGGKVIDSRYVMLPLSFPTNTSISMSYFDTLTIDTATGVITGANFGFSSSASYKLTNRKSGKVLTVSGIDKNANTARIQQLTDSGALYQRWQLVNAGNGYYRIASRQSGKYMDIINASTADGAENVQYPSTGGANQEWQLISKGSGYWVLENRNSHKVLEILSGSTADNAQSVQWTTNSGTNQEFKIE